MRRGIHIRPGDDLEAKLVRAADASAVSASYLGELILSEWFSRSLGEDDMYAATQALVERNGVPPMRGKRRRPGPDRAGA